MDRSFGTIELRENGCKPPLVVFNRDMRGSNSPFTTTLLPQHKDGIWVEVGSSIEDVDELVMWHGYQSRDIANRVEALELFGERESRRYCHLAPGPVEFSFPLDAS